MLAPRSAGEAEKDQATAIEEEFEEVTLEVLEHIMVARVKLKMSWHVIAVSLNVIFKKPEGLMGNSEGFDERDVEKPFQRQSDARTTIHAKCKNDGFPRGMLWVIPMTTSAGLRNKQAGLPGRKIPVDSPDSPDTTMAMTGYEGTDIEGSSTREG